MILTLPIEIAEYDSEHWEPYYIRKIFILDFPLEEIYSPNIPRWVQLYEIY